MARCLPILMLVLSLTASAAQGVSLSDRALEVYTQSGMFVLRQILPDSFFRHARDAAPVSHDGSDLERSTSQMSDSEFRERFPPVPVDRALDIYYVIAMAQEVFQHLGVKALPVGGTQLGMLRNGGLLPHDDDADFAVLESEVPKILEARNLFLACDLDIRTIPGLGLQIYPRADHGTLGLLYRYLLGKMSTALEQIADITISKEPLTERGFIDILPIRWHSSDEVYRYAGNFAEEIWWQQTISRELFEGPFYDYPFGPITIAGPAWELAAAANAQAYPDSLTHAMRTPDHRFDHNIKAVLVPLTEEQKRPYPLTSDDLAVFQKRLTAGRKALNLYAH